MFFLLCCSLLNLHIFIIHVFNRFFMLYMVKIGYVNKIHLCYNLFYLLLFFNLCTFQFPQQSVHSLLSSICLCALMSSLSPVVHPLCSSFFPGLLLWLALILLLFLMLLWIAHCWTWPAVSSWMELCCFCHCHHCRKKNKWITNKIEQIWPEEVASLSMGFCCIFKLLHL